MIDVNVSANYIGDCRDLLTQLPDGCVQTCITSPPYWGLRDYGHEGQIGLESTPEEYVAEIVEVFRAVHRVLRDDGTLWLNLGDCYVTNPRGPGGAATSTLTGSSDSERRKKRWEASGRNGLPHPNNRTTDPKVKGRTHTSAVARGLRDTKLKHKDLVGIPWMVAFALRSDGWYLRSDIIWHKPNPMPESVRDRPTKAHEYLFLLSKSADYYYYDADAIREPLAAKTLTTFGTTRHSKGNDALGKVAADNWSRDVPVRKPKLDEDGEITGANKRSVWTVSPQPYTGAHFATFPPKLIEPCVLAGSRPGDLVLDPFFGSGTTGKVAESHGRRWIGFDLGYDQLAKERTAQRSLLSLLPRTT